MQELVKFHPTKRLFIDTLTKDISVRDCIFDLLDNAVDSYVRHKIRERREIRVEFDKEKFLIYDNCGGISVDHLLNHVFRFGVIDTAVNLPTIGVYGIGLKRAIFKLGRKIFFKTDDGSDYSCLKIDVDEWVQKSDERLEDWNIPLLEHKKTKLKSGEKPYTHIEITNLNEETKETFTEAFTQRLKKAIQIYYALFIQDNIDIFINNEIQQPFEIRVKIRWDSNPASFLDEYNNVEIKIICWIEYREEEKRIPKKEKRQGWNVFMNKRLILHDNVGPETGWTGEQPHLPKFHSIFNDFRGIVYLISNDPSKLPLNTEKNGFDRENATYIYLLKKMIYVAKPLIQYLERKYDKQKREVQEHEEKLEDFLQKQRGDKKPKEISIDKITRNRNFTPPDTPIIKLPKTTTISYQKPKEQVTKLKKRFKVRSNAEVGSESFDYCFNSLAEGSDEE